MTDLISGQKLGSEMCKALGIDPEDVYSLDIYLAHDTAATITVVRYITTEQGKELSSALEQYKIERLE